jgi:hypothetical protein
MNRSRLIIAGAAAAVVLTGVLLFTRKGEEHVSDASAPLTNTTTSATAEPTPASAPTEPAAGTSTPILPPAATASTAPATDDEDPTKITFKADDKGRMVTNEKARLNLERLYALYTPEERQKKLDELSEGLPPAAARDLADLMDRYANYDSAQRQTFPPGQDLATPEEGLNVIDGMHNLRVQYFGADVANGFFGKEEKIQRELLRLMSLEKDGSMTIEEKAERAQAMYQNQMPETAAELAAGRKQAESKAN